MNAIFPYHWPLILFGIFFVGCVGMCWALVLHQRRRLDRCRREVEQARLEHALDRHRLNPHFLLNGLNNIAASILLDRDVALDYTHRLADMLKVHQALASQTEIPLADEITCIDNYLALQQYTMGDRITIRFDKRVADAGVRLPPLLLSTLIEVAMERSQAPGNKPVVDILLHADESRVALRVQHTLPEHPRGAGRPGSPYTMGTPEGQRVPGTPDVAGMSETPGTPVLISMLEQRLQWLFPGKHTLQVERSGGRESASLELTLAGKNKEM